MDRLHHTSDATPRSESGTYSKFYHTFMRRKDVSPAEKMVWLAIDDRVGRNGESWPSHACIAADTGMSRRNVQFCIARLTAIGLLFVDPPAPGRKSNTYRTSTCAKSVVDVRKACAGDVRKKRGATCANIAQEPDQGTKPNIEPAAGTSADAVVLKFLKSRGIHDPAATRIARIPGISLKAIGRLRSEISQPDYVRIFVSIADKRLPEIISTLAKPRPINDKYKPGVEFYDS